MRSIQWILLGLAAGLAFLLGTLPGAHLFPASLGGMLGVKIIVFVGLLYLFWQFARWHVYVLQHRPGIQKNIAAFYLICVATFLLLTVFGVLHALMRV